MAFKRVRFVGARWSPGHRWTAFAGCLVALACARRPPYRDYPVLRDPMVVVADAAAPADSFDGTGSLFLGHGWGRPEGNGAAGDWGSYSWVLGLEAEVEARIRPGEPMDFFGRCLPYPWNPGGPPQTMELFAGDALVAKVDLVGDWQDVRIPLPDSLQSRNPVRLRLRFEHALQPPNDARQLAAAFTEIAVVPRATRSPREFLGQQRFDPQSGGVSLPVRGALAIPFPAASHVDLQLQRVQASCQACSLAMELTGTNGFHRTLSPRNDVSARTASIAFDTEPRGIDTLWIRVAPDTPQASGSLRFDLGGAAIEPAGRGAAGQAAESGPAQPPHVFVYLIDTLRADSLSAYGGKPDLAPAMNAFARDGVAYLEARAGSTWTLPSVVSLLTGLYPDRHGVMDGKTQFDADRQPSLQLLLGQHGFHTVGISHSFIASPAFGMDTGFEHFYFRNQLNGGQLRSQRARRQLASWLSVRADGAPVFAYIHTVDPHAPYTPPEDLRAGIGPVPPAMPWLAQGLPGALAAKGGRVDPAGVAYLRALYDGEVHYTDREFGRFLDLLKWLGLYDHSIVILVGDHGEEFAEHGGFDHGTTVFDEVLRVPLVVKFPGSRWAGYRSRAPVSLVDVVPTLLSEISAGAAVTAFDGQPLPGPQSSEQRAQPVYFEVSPAHDAASPDPAVNLRGLIWGGIKCIENRIGVDRFGRPSPLMQAFRLAEDAEERAPLPAADPETARCQRQLDAWAQARRRDAERQRSRREATPATFDDLRSLGYIH